MARIAAGANDIDAPSWQSVGLQVLTYAGRWVGLVILLVTWESLAQSGMFTAFVLPSFRHLFSAPGALPERGQRWTF